MLAFNSNLKLNADCSADLLSRAFIGGLCSGNETSFQLVFSVTHHHEESIQTAAPPAVTFALLSTNTEVHQLCCNTLPTYCRLRRHSSRSRQKTHFHTCAFATLCLERVISKYVQSCVGMWSEQML